MSSCYIKDMLRRKPSLLPEHTTASRALHSAVPLPSRMQLLQRPVLQAPPNMRLQSKGLPVHCAVVRGGCCSKHPPQAGLTWRSIVPSANTQVHGLLNPSSHAKQLQCCGAQRSYGEERLAMGGALARQITQRIKDSHRLQDLEDIADEDGSSFDYRHTSAAFVKAAKLAQDRPARAASLLDKLVHIWHEQYSQSGTWGLANVLWASSKLQVNDRQLWRESLEHFIQSLGQAAFQDLSNVVYALALQASHNNGLVPGLSKNELRNAVGVLLEQVYVLVMHPALEGVYPQDIANIMWGIGKLVYPVDTATLSALLRALLRPRLAAAITPQNWSNSMLGLSWLVKVCDLRAVVTQPICARLLSGSAVGIVADSIPQHVSNTLLALGRLSDGHQPILSRTLAQQCGLQLLQGSGTADLTTWNAQNIANSLWACAKMHLGQVLFVEAVVADPLWLSKANNENLKQVAWASSTMGIRNLQFMTRVVECSQQQLTQSHSGTPAASVVGLVAVASCAVARLDMRALAAEAVALVQSPVMVPHLRCRLDDRDASMLWQVHTWLVKHNLLDGQGLSNCLTSGQLGVAKQVYEQYLASGGHGFD